MSSQPVRLTTLAAGLMKTPQVATKSAPVTGLPSLQFAFALNLNVTVSGLFFTIFGLASHSCGIRLPFSFRFSQPSKIRLVISAVA